LREFAVTELKLPDNASYHRYADLGRDSVVWNVVATPELSLTLHTWCVPVMGCVGYRGFFAQADAQALATQLRGQGLEVNVYGVPAYSTLGWTNWLGGDPLLNTFIRWPEPDLARLIFHELAHQVAYAADDTQFNESYATAVERLGSARWAAASGHAPEDAATAQRRADFKALTLRTRARLEALYASPLTDADKRLRKAEALAALQAEYAAIKAGPWGGYTGYDAWMAKVNNASLAVQAAYDGLVPEFERLFEQQGRDFARFHAEVKRLAGLPKDERRATLQALH
jgi:predicted aminopeptidase